MVWLYSKKSAENATGKREIEVGGFSSLVWEGLLMGSTWSVAEVIVASRLLSHSEQSDRTLPRLTDSSQSSRRPSSSQQTDNCSHCSDPGRHITLGSRQSIRLCIYHYRTDSDRGTVGVEEVGPLCRLSRIQRLCSVLWSPMRIWQRICASPYITIIPKVVFLFLNWHFKYTSCFTKILGMIFVHWKDRLFACVHHSEWLHCTILLIDLPHKAVCIPTHMRYVHI